MVLRRNHGMAILDSELKAEHPGIVIGWIGDNRHAVENPTSDHNAKKLNGDEVVNAIDPMIGKTFTASDADETARMIRTNPAAFRRLKYMIWDRRIMSGPKGNAPGVWRRYTGTSDPHTGHMHISVLDSADDDQALWLKKPVGVKVKYIDVTGKLPILTMGMSDDDYSGWNMIARIQDLRGLEPDGEYGPKTAANLKDAGFGDGKTIDESVYRAVLGLAYP